MYGVRLPAFYDDLIETHVGVFSAIRCSDCCSYRTELLYGVLLIFIIGNEFVQILRRYFLEKTKMSRVYADNRAAGEAA